MSLKVFLKENILKELTIMHGLLFFMWGISLAIIHDAKDTNQAAAYAAISAVFISLIIFIQSCADNKLKSKNDEQILLCMFGQRYSTDDNIRRVVKWIMANLDNKGLIKKEKNLVNVPDFYEKTVFMSFFEDIYNTISQEIITKSYMMRRYSYYAIKFDEYDFFHQDISNYNTGEWSSFHEFVSTAKKYRK